MPSEKPLLRLEDIVKNAEHIAQYIDGMSEITFCKDHKTINAVERCIERICEATKKLGDDIKLRIGDYPWLDISDMGNRLRHDYDKVALAVVWRTASVEIPLLAADCMRVLEEIRSAQNATD